MRQSNLPPDPVAPPIRILSALGASSVAGQLRIYEEMHAAEKVMRALYAPLITSICKESVNPGKGKAVLDRMTRNWKAPSSLSVKAKSEAALLQWCMEWRHEFPVILDAKIRRNRNPCSFEGFVLKGGLHLHAKDKKGEEVLLYVHASEFQPKEMQLHLEMLAILAEHKYGMRRDQVRLLDFHDLRILRPETSYKARRREVRNLCRLYQVFASRVKVL